MNRLPMPEAIVFDCYDTLLMNDQSAWRSLFGDISVEQGLGVGGDEFFRVWKEREVKFREGRVNMVDQWASRAFRSYEEAWGGCFEYALAALGVAGDSVAAARRAVEHMGSRPAFPETLAALSSLQGRCALGVFSNADDDFLLPALARTGVDWAAVASSESARVYKPLTKAFMHIAGLLGVDARGIWYVGDNLFDDVLGANTAGMVSVWINRGGSCVEGESAPDAEIKDLHGLSALLDVCEAKSPGGGRRS